MAIKGIHPSGHLPPMDGASFVLIERWEVPFVAPRDRKSTLSNTHISPQIMKLICVHSRYRSSRPNVSSSHYGQSQSDRCERDAR